MNTDWPKSYLGDQWIARKHDCWIFARRVWLEIFGWDVPAVDIDALDLRACITAFAHDQERANWIEVNSPIEGDAVAMGTNKTVTHIGIWTTLNRGGVVHCMRHSGVVFSTVRALTNSGVHILGYYRRAIPCKRT